MNKCEYSNDSEKGLKQHTRMKYRVSQLDGIDDTNLSDIESKGVKNPVQNSCQLCKDGDKFCIGKCGNDCE